MIFRQKVSTWPACQSWKQPQGFLTQGPHLSAKGTERLTQTAGDKVYLYSNFGLLVLVQFILYCTMLLFVLKLSGISQWLLFLWAEQCSGASSHAPGRIISPCMAFSIRPKWPRSTDSSFDSKMSSYQEIIYIKLLLTINSSSKLL